MISMLILENGPESVRLYYLPHGYHVKVFCHMVTMCEGVYLENLWRHLETYGTQREYETMYKLGPHNMYFIQSLVEKVITI